MCIYMCVSVCVCVCVYVCVCVCVCVWVNVERGNAAEKLSGRNINVSFTNNSYVPIEEMIFVFYSDEISINVERGLLTRHKN